MPVMPLLTRLVRHPWLMLAGFVVITTLLLTAVLSFRVLPSRHQPKQGQLADATIRAPARTAYESAVLTERQRQQAADRVPKVLVAQPEVITQQDRRLHEIDQLITAVRGTNLTRDARQKAIQEIRDVRLSPGSAGAIADMTTDQWQAAVGEAQRLLTATLAVPVTAEDLSAAEQRLRALGSTQLGPPLTTVATDLALSLLQPNMVVDISATERVRREAAALVPTARVTLEPGDVIVREGELVDDLIWEKLEASGLIHPPLRPGDIAGGGLFSLVLVGLLGMHLRLQPRILGQPRRLLLLMVVIVGTVVAAKLFIPERALYAYGFPVAVAPMLIASLVDAQPAMVVAVVLSLLVTFVAGNTLEQTNYVAGSALGSLELTVYYLAGGLAAIWSVWRAQRIVHFLIAGGWVGLANLAVIAVFRLLRHDADMNIVGWFVTAALGNGLLAAVLTIGALLLLGAVFGISTNFHLMELGQPDQALLRRLLTEAPGTYHHSLIVANLAEQAAAAIGADPLLARIGAYYHDVGKVVRPGFFVENQLGGENVHDHLDPLTSATIIAAHVADGLELAGKYRLPARVQDFIAQHHGTRYITYFYHRAVQQQDDVDPSLFRYPGPRPQSREAGIVMLADSIEAAARSSPDRSSEALERVVDHIIGERLEEGQLEQCELTLRDVEQVRAAFKAVIRGVFHPRVPYPENLPLKEGLFASGAESLRALPDVEVPALADVERTE